MKGQISFDFILAITVAVVLIASISVLAQGINDYQKESTIRAQAKKISLELARIYALSETLEGYANYDIRFNLEKIKMPDGTETDCEINLDSSKQKVFVSVQFEGKTIIEETPLNLLSWSHPVTTPIKCGDQLVISK